MDIKKSTVWQMLVGFGIGLTGGILFSLFAFHAEKYPKYIGIDELIESRISIETQELNSMAKDLKSDVQNIRTGLNRLSTDEIEMRIRKLEGTLESLTRQVHSLQQIISPKNASDILTVARMKEELLARSEFEGKIKENIKRFDTRIDKSEDRVDKLQYWIWGVLLTLIGGLVSVSVFLGRRLNIVLAQIPSETVKSDE